MALNLRGPDALAVLKHKEALRAGLVESDTVAVLHAGGKTFTLPVYIQKNGGTAVESDFTFHEARANTNIVVDGETATIVKFEKITEPVAEQPPPPELAPQEIFNERLREARKANPGENELALRLRVTEQMSREALAQRQQNRQGQQSSFGTLPDRWASFAAAAKRQRNNSR
jgi:hypothetical protein